MSWIKGTSVKNLLPRSPRKINDPPVKEEIDGQAALDSFKTHWFQAWAIMQQKTVPSSESDSLIAPDDITIIVNHIDQMVTLLLQESEGAIQGSSTINDQNSHLSPIMMSPLLDFMFMESILDKLFSWSSNVGEWSQVMQLEQLKLYELLVSQLCHQEALFQKPLMRPLINLLSQCHSNTASMLEVEKRLVVLLNTLCVCLSQNVNLLELFFQPEPVISSQTETRFLIFSLLIPFIHREGAIGQQARDALLLCMALSRKNDKIGEYISENSNFCPVLATGLSGLYSSLPRRLDFDTFLSDDWHQLTPEDIQGTPELEMFLNSLEFCNAVVQVSHPFVQQQLLDYIYNGFLIPVIAPALHQNTLEEIIAATAYLELFLRTISEPILLQVFLKFICTEKYDDQRILDTLIERIGAYSKLSLITMVLFRTMLELNCEDVMVELILKHMLMLQQEENDLELQRKRINDVCSYNLSAHKFLSLIPKCCLGVQTSHYVKNGTLPEDYEWVDRFDETSQANIDSNDVSQSDIFPMVFNYFNYFADARRNVLNCIRGTQSWTRKYDSFEIVNELSLAKSEMNHVKYNACNGCDKNELSVGSFLNALLSRLEGFCENDVYTNLQLTGLISRLACYPQPLLRSYLLNHVYVFQIKCRNFWDILLELQMKIDLATAQIENVGDLLFKARKFLSAREDRLLDDAQIRYFNRDTTSIPPSSRKNSITSEFPDISKALGRKRRSIKDFLSFGRHRNANTSASVPSTPTQTLEPLSEFGYKFHNKSFTEHLDSAVEADENEEINRTQKIILAALVFEEFLKELSAITYEHYVSEIPFYVFNNRV